MNEVNELSPAGLTKQIQQAMKSGDKLRVGVLRMLLTSIKNAQVAKMDELSDEEAIAVVTKEMRRREEAAQEFEKAGRADRAEAERAEAEVLKPYLPEQLADDVIATLVQEAIAESGASDPSQMGKVMAILMPKIKGRADGKAVSDLVRSKLS